MEKKDYKYIERVVKGFANQWRIRIMELLSDRPELSIAEISEVLNADFKNISAHVTKLAIAGIVMKRSDGKSIRHKLTPRGIRVLTFVRTLAHV